MRMGTGHRPAAGAGRLWLAEGGFWSALTSFPGPPVRRGHIQVPGDGSGDPITWAGWAAAHGQRGGLGAGAGAWPLLTAHLSKLGKQGSASPASPSRDPMALAQALHGHRHPMGMGRGSHLAGAAGTGLSLGNEALAVLHFPALVVAVWGYRGPEAVFGEFEGDFGRFRGILGNPPPRARTLTDGAAPTLGVEGVGAHDGTFQRRAGH